MRILLVGVNYAPEHAGIGPYTTELAEEYATLGHEVTVLTGMPHYPAWKVRAEYAHRFTARENHNNVNVVRRAVYVPKRQSAMRRAAYEASFLLSGWWPAGLPRPDVIVGVVPSLSGGVLARLLSGRFGSPYGLLFQDLMGPAAAQSGVAGGGAVARATCRAERWAVSRATAVAAVAEAFFPYLRSIGVPADCLFHVPNWSRQHGVSLSEGERTARRTSLGWAPSELVVLHAGNMGLKQGLHQVLGAARLAQETGEAIRFVLLGEGSQRQQLQVDASRMGLRNLEFLPPLAEHDFMSTLAAADVLLLTERATVRDMALPSKLTSYAMAARPVVAAVNADAATAAELRRSGMALIVPPEQPQAMVTTLRGFQGNPAMRHDLAQAGPSYAHRLLRRESALARAAAFVEMAARPYPRAMSFFAQAELSAPSDPLSADLVAADQAAAATPATLKTKEHLA